MAFEVSDNWLFIYFTNFASTIKSLAYLLELLKINFSETFVEQTCDIGFPSTIIVSYLWSFKHEVGEFVYEQLSTPVKCYLISFVSESYLHDEACIDKLMWIHELVDILYRPRLLNRPSV